MTRQSSGMERLVSNCNVNVKDEAIARELAYYLKWYVLFDADELYGEKRTSSEQFKWNIYRVYAFSFNLVTVSRTVFLMGLETKEDLDYVGEFERFIGGYRFTYYYAQLLYSIFRWQCLL